MYIFQMLNKNIKALFTKWMQHMIKKMNKSILHISIHVLTLMFYCLAVGRAKPITWSQCHVTIRFIRNVHSGLDPLFIYSLRLRLWAQSRHSDIRLEKQTSLDNFHQSNNAPNNLPWKYHEKYIIQQNNLKGKICHTSVIYCIF